MTKLYTGKKSNTKCCNQYSSSVRKYWLGSILWQYNLLQSYLHYRCQWRLCRPWPCARAVGDVGSALFSKVNINAKWRASPAHCSIILSSWREIYLSSAWHNSLRLGRNCCSKWRTFRREIVTQNYFLFFSASQHFTSKQIFRGK